MVNELEVLLNGVREDPLLVTDDHQLPYQWGVGVGGSLGVVEEELSAVGIQAARSRAA